MKFSRFLKTQSGMTLVEIMMAVAISGGLALTVARLLQNMNESTKQIEAKNENISLKGMVQNTLSDSDACKNTFNPLITQTNLNTLSGSSTATVNVPAIKNKINTTVFSTASTNIDPLTITGMSLTNYVAATGTADLVIRSTFRKSPSQIMSVKPAVIALNFNIQNPTSATPTLVACSTMAVGSGEWLRTGNAGTIDGTDYLGTSDSAPLNFRVNAQRAGRIDMSNTGLGYQSFLASDYTQTSGNTAIGTNALQSIRAQGKNVAIGFAALQSTVSSTANVGVGVYALQATTTGTGNTGIGTQASARATTASENTSVGTSALTTNETGFANVAVGGYAGMFNSNGQYNTFVGHSAGRNMQTGSNNVFLGYNAGSGTPTYSSYKLAIEASGNPVPLIEGDFRARTTLIDGNVGIDLLDGSSPTSKLVISDRNSGADNVMMYVDWQTPYPAGSKTGIYSRVNPAGYFSEASFGIMASNYSPDNAHGYMYGIRADASAQTPGMMGRTYGVFATAGNGTSGHNNAVVALVTGASSQIGTAIWASGIFGDWPQDVSPYCPTLSGSCAGVFRGDLVVDGDIRVVDNNLGGTPQIKGRVYANGVALTSDLRLKKNVKVLNNSLEKVVQLRGVRYHWKSDEKNKNAELGVIAQEVEKQFPESVLTSSDQLKTKSVNYPSLIAPIIEAIKELYAKIVALIASDEKQNDEIKKLKAENAKLKEEMRMQQEMFDERMRKLESEMKKKK